MTARRVLVTGGGSGIGLATARALLDDGADVALADLRFTDVAEALPAARIVTDISLEDDVQRAFGDACRSLGGLDVVVHCAGIMREQRRDLREVTLDSWQSVINVNLTGTFLVAREAVRIMAASSGGVLILVGSGAGTTGPSGSIPYGASKGGVNGLAMTLAEHLSPFGIRVHNFLPGSVDTPLIHRSFAEGLKNGATHDATASARSHLADPMSVGRVLAFLASEDADAVRGNVSSW